LASRAYEDTALPIGQGQTISQPWVVAFMTQALIDGHIPQKVLEVGTGCGYQSAVLAQLIPEVLTVERIEALHRSARLRLRKLGYQNIRFKLAGEEWGWPEQGPFDGILVTAAGTEVPVSLLAQLAVGGVMIIPIGPPGQQDLIKYTRLKDTFDCVRLTGVSFVPLIRGGA
jgi:protein-L-isoaspartate(D-aspartate) O-methyltransferase